MPWTINADAEGIAIERFPGESPGGKYRATTNLRIITSNLGDYSSTQNIFAGNPPKLSATIQIFDSASLSARTRTQTTRVPASQIAPDLIGGFIPSEVIEETYSYSSSSSSGCIDDIKSGTLEDIITEIRRPIGAFVDYIAYLKRKSLPLPSLAALVVAESRIKRFEYNSKGQTISRTEITREDPRALAGVLKGIEWESIIFSGLYETKIILESWEELRRNDWQYTRQEYESWARVSPNSIPQNTPLQRQIQPVLTISETSASTSQNQPPAAERAPQAYSETNRFTKEELDFTNPAAPFEPKLRIYNFATALASNLWNLGKIAGEHEYGKASQIEFTGTLTDEWFTYRPYQSVRLDEAEESGIYAISSMTFVLDADEISVGFRGLLVATVDPVTSNLSLPYTPPSVALSGTMQSQIAQLQARVLAPQTIGGIHMTGQSAALNGIMVATSAPKSLVGSIQTTQPALSGVATLVRILSGAIEKSERSTTSGRFVAPQNLFGTISANNQRSLGGSLIGGQTLSRDFLASRPTLSGIIRKGQILAGSMSTNQPVLTGLLREGRLILGGIAANQPTMLGRLNIGQTLSGSINANAPTLTGVLDMAYYLTQDEADLLYAKIALGKIATQTFTTNSLAVGARQLGTFNLSTTWIPISYTSSAPAEIRIYNSLSDQASDQVRSPTDIPVVQVFQQTTTVGQLTIVSPIRQPFGSAATPRTISTPITVYNRGGSAAIITVTFIYLVLEE